MIIIGERINSTRKTIDNAIKRKDLDFLIEEAKNQTATGASFIDCNCASSMQNEANDLIWLIEELQKKLKYSISIDSPNPAVIEEAIKIHKGRPFINSITAENEKMKKLLPIIKRHNCYAVALTITDGGMPDNIEERVTLAERIISAAQKADIPIKDIYVDPLVKPVSTEPNQAKYYLKALEILKERGINTIGGLSNVSFGLPNRHLLNAVFLQLAIESGITAAIIDPTNNLTKMALDGKKLPDEVFKVAKKVLLGEDEYAMEYIKAFRSGSLSLNP